MATNSEWNLRDVSSDGLICWFSGQVSGFDDVGCVACMLRGLLERVHDAVECEMCDMAWYHM